MLIAYKLLDGACCSLSGIPFIVMVPDHRFDPPRLCEKKKKNCVQKEKRRRRRRRRRRRVHSTQQYIYTEMIELLWIFLVLQKICRVKKKYF